MSINGIGSATTAAKNAIKHATPRAYGEPYPPTFYVIIPPAITPAVGAVIQVIEKYTKTVSY